MTKVDWYIQFNSFYEVVRVKVACKHCRRIPIERIFEMNKQRYVISFMVEDEGAKNQCTGNDNGDDGGGDDG
jgi:hypothetical protein